MSALDREERPWIPGTSGLSLGQIRAILWARRWLVLAVTVVVTLLALLLTLSTPRVYESWGTLLIDFQANDPIQRGSFSALLEENYLNTQMSVLSSRRVISRAIELAGLDQDPETRQQFQDEQDGVGDFNDWLAGQVSEDVTISSPKDSRIVTIGAEADNPDKAATLVNAVIDAYLSISLEIAKGPATRNAQRFSTQAAGTRASVQQAQDELEQFQQSAGLVEFGDRLDAEKERLNALSTQLAQAQSEAQTARTRARSVEQLRATGAPIDRQAKLVQSELLEQVRGDLSVLRSRRAEQARVLGPNHPRLRQLDAEVAAAESELRALVDQNVESLRNEADILDDDAAAARRRFEAQRNRVLELDRKRNQAITLRRSLEEAEGRHEAAIERSERVALSAERAETGASVVRRAVADPVPTKPNRKLNMIAGVVCGGLLGLAIALVLELARRRIRTPEDIERELGLAVIAEVPA